jgi:hypothetical protein
VEPSPLSPEQLERLATARRQLSSLRSAGTVAALNGWTLAGCAALCFPLAFADPVLLFVGAGLAGAAWAELRGRAMLRVPDPRAPRWLAWNQAATFLVVFSYCAWRIGAGLLGPRPSEAPGVAELLDSVDAAGVAEAIDRLYPVVLVGFYGVVITASALYQAACAAYYLRRRAPIEHYLADTPAWVREVLQACGGFA